LSSYRKNIGYSDDEYCTCGAQETVTYVLVDCPNLRETRRELRREVGDVFNSISSLLGGSKQGERGKPDIILRARIVRHEGILTMGTAIRPREALTRL
jgi:hypothetical protein